MIFDLIDLNSNKMMQDPKFNSLSAMNSQSTVKTDSKPVAKEQDPYEAMKKSPWIHAWSDSVAGFI